MANHATFAISKGAAVQMAEDDDIEEDLVTAAELAEERQMSGQDDVPQSSVGKGEIFTLYRFEIIYI